MRNRIRPSRRQFLSRTTAAALGGGAAGCVRTARRHEGPLATTSQPSATPDQVAQAPDEPVPTPGRFQDPEQTAPAQPVGVEPQVTIPSKRRALGPNDRIRCAAIGVGNRGSELLRAALARNDVDVVAVADAYDVWLDRAVTRCRRKRPGVNRSVRFEVLLEHEDLDAVIIATPDHIHTPAILAALDAGLDVYIEKPMTLTWQQAKAVRDRVRETGAVVQVGTQLRSTDIYQRAREVVQSGAIGRVISVRVNRSYSTRGLAGVKPPGDADASNVHWEVFLRDTHGYPFDLVRFFYWRQFREYSNGYTGDLMLHHLDICHFILGCGMPERVMSVGGIYRFNDGRTCPDTISVIAEYPEQFMFNYTTTVANGYYGHAERYIGTSGVLELRNMRELVIATPDGQKVIKSKGLNTAGHVADFFDCMRRRGKPIAPIDAGFQAAVCCHMAVLSEETGESAKWDPVAEQVLL